MEKMIRTTLFIFAVSLLFSCTTSQTIKIHAPSGTEIYTPSMERIATVSSGAAKVKLPSENYYAYLLSRSQGSADFIPFALDYKKKNYFVTRSLNGVAYFLAVAGLFADGVGLCALKDESTSRAFLIPGSSGLLVGSFLGLTTSCRLSQTLFEYRFRYLSNQVTNQDLAFTYPVFHSNQIVSETFSDGKNMESEPKTVKTTSAKPQVFIGKNKNKSTSIAKKIEGDYLCKGQLLFGDEMVESYDGVKVEIKGLGRKTALVNVFDSDGESFFSTPAQYSVQQLSNGKILLSHKEIKGATITIDGKTIQYINPKVSIDGNTYVLKMTSVR